MSQYDVVDRGKSAWSMGALAFTSQNLSVGMTFGMLGAFVPVISEAFGSKRLAISIAMALLVATMGVFSPVVGKAISTYGVKRVVLTGSLIFSIGLLALSASPNIVVFVLIFGLWLGASFSAFGANPATTIVTQWFPTHPGRMVGLVMLPAGAMMVPILSTMSIQAFGWRPTLVIFAFVVMAFWPLFMMLRLPKRPKNESPQAKTGSLDASAGDPVIGTRFSDAIKNKDFVVGTLATSILISAGIAVSIHIISFGRDLGYDANTSAFMQSIHAGSSALGAVAFGILADRIGARRALMGLGVMLAAAWLALTMTLSYEALIFALVCAGMCAGGSFPAFTTFLNQNFGHASYSRLFGYAGLIKAPFMLLGAPIFGYIADTTGSYALAFQGYALAFLFASAMLGLAVKNAPARPLASAPTRSG